MGLGWLSLGRVKYRAHYGAKNVDEGECSLNVPRVFSGRFFSVFPVFAEYFLSVL